MSDCEFPSSNGRQCLFLLELLQKYPISSDEINQVLESGCCDLNQKNSSCMTPLKAAIMNGDIETVRLLLERGARVDDEVLEFTKVKYSHKVGLIPVLEAEALLAKAEAGRPRCKRRGL